MHSHRPGADAGGGGDVVEMSSAAAPPPQEAAGKAEQPAAEKSARRERRSRSSRPAPVGGSFANRARGEQVAAGWPAWLSAVAGEAIDGWTPRRADSFEKIDKVRALACFRPPLSRSFHHAPLCGVRRPPLALVMEPTKACIFSWAVLGRSGRARTATCTRRATR